MGRTVIAGGPLFTTGHLDFPEIPHFVLGEAEDVIGELVRDMQAGTVKPSYRANKFPDVRTTPVPRWDLIDIVSMYGRVPRTKTPAQIIGELEALRAAGWRQMVFLVETTSSATRSW